MNIALPTQRMKVPEFLAWAETQSEGRYELVDGVIRAMAPERIVHGLVKKAVVRALDDAIREAALPCTALPDCAGVYVSDKKFRIPDASVQCGVELDPNSMILDAPLIVVEVVSPSSQRKDTLVKLIEYFSVSSIHHYLIVLPEEGVILHHERRGEGILTHIVRDGEITLAPPGITVPFAALLGPAPSAGAQFRPGSSG
jgi:Uma2 family endonuclease